MGRGLFLRCLPTTDTQREGYTQDAEVRTEKTALTRRDRRGHVHIPPPPRRASVSRSRRCGPGEPRPPRRADPRWHTAGTRAGRLGLPRSAAAALRLRPPARTHPAGLGLWPSV